MSQAETMPLENSARTFAALGDPTRLILIGLLADEAVQSVSTLANQTTLTRQAVGKHLRILERSDLVTSCKYGRERQYRLNGEAIDDASDYLRSVSGQWKNALERLKRHIEG